MPRIFGVDIEAVSVGGLETCIELPGWDLCFDIGRCPPSAVRKRRLAITHGHMDHAGGVAYHASMRDLLGMPPPTVFVPRVNAPDFEALFATWRRLDRSELPVDLVPIAPGERVDLGGRRFLEPFRSPHRVFCQGYALGTYRQRLRPEYAGLAAPELERLRRQGARLSETVEVIEVAFTGDTTIDVLDTTDLVARAKLLVLEVTFYDGTIPPARAHAKGHVHLDDVVANLHRLPNPGILLTHASARHSAAQVRAALDHALSPADRARIVALPELVGAPPSPRG